MFNAYLIIAGIVANISYVFIQHTLTKEKRWYRFGLYNFVASSLSVIFLCVILGVVITTYKNVISHAKGKTKPSLFSPKLI